MSMLALDAILLKILQLQIPTGFNKKSTLAKKKK